MNFLFIGDITGEAGLDRVRKEIAALRRQETFDLIIANGENLAERNGIHEALYRALRFAGVDVVTMGNHTWAHKGILEIIDREKELIRPANYPEGTAGRGYTIVDTGRRQVAVMNVLGNIYVSTLPSPFSMIDKLLQEIRAQGVQQILIDFHGEATSEKMAFAYYLDGQVTAVLGTHTHVQTADARILPKGTAYITDVGMCGAYESVLGVKKEHSIESFITQIPTKFEHADGKSQFNAVIVKSDDKTGQAVEIKRLYFVD